MLNRFLLFLKEKVSNYPFIFLLGGVAFALAIFLNIFSGTPDASELQTELEAESIDSYVVFGEREQYVAIDYHSSSSITESDLMAGKHRIIKFFDASKINHSAYLVSFNIDDHMKKEIIDLKPYLNKIPDFKSTDRITVKFRTVHGQDVLFLKLHRPNGNLNYIYNLETGNFMSQDLKTFIYYQDKELYEGNDTALKMREPGIWDYIKVEKGLKKDAEYDKNPLASSENILKLETSPLDTKNIEQIDLFKENPKIKAVYHRAKYPQSGALDDAFYVFARKGIEGDYPPEPIKPVEPRKPTKPEGTSKILIPWSKDVYPNNQSILTEIKSHMEFKKYQEDLEEYQEAFPKYQEDIKVYNNLLKKYEANKAKNFDKDSQIYFSLQEFKENKISWLNPVGLSAQD